MTIENQAADNPAVEQGGDPTEGLTNPIYDMLGAGGETNEETVPETTEQEEESQTIVEPDVTEPQVDTHIPDKFKNPDGSVNVNALLKSYSSLESKLGEQGNELGQMQELQRQLDELTGLVQNQHTQAEPEPDEPQFTQEQVDEMNEQFLQEFYENPLQALGKLVTTVAQSTVQPIIEPIASEWQQSQQEAFWNQQVNELAEANPEEFELLQPIMSEITDSHSGIIESLPDESKLQYVYNQAKVVYAEQNKQKSPDELLNDPEFQKKILENESIKSQFLQNHAQSIKEGKPPVVISSKAGGQPPAAPSEEIKSISDATRAAKQFFLRKMGGM